MLTSEVVQIKKYLSYDYTSIQYDHNTENDLNWMTAQVLGHLLFGAESVKKC